MGDSGSKCLSRVGIPQILQIKLGKNSFKQVAIKQVLLEYPIYSILKSSNFKAKYIGGAYPNYEYLFNGLISSMHSNPRYLYISSSFYSQGFLST